MFLALQTINVKNVCLLWCWLYCTNFHNFINIQYSFFLAERTAYFWKWRYKQKAEEWLISRRDKIPEATMWCTTPGSSKPSGVCSYVHLITTLSKLEFSFYILLKIFNLEDLMQSNFRERFIFAHKGTKTKIS